MIIELKTPEPELARRTVDDIKAAGALDRVVLGSFHWRALAEARRYEPRIPTGAAREETRWALYRSWVRWPLGRTKYQEFQVPERAGATVVVTPNFIAHAHRAELPVRVWTVDTREDILRLLDWGADSIISDRPDVAVGVCGSGVHGEGGANGITTEKRSNGGPSKLPARRPVAGVGMSAAMARTNTTSWSWCS